MFLDTIEMALAQLFSLQMLAFFVASSSGSTGK